MQKTERQQKCTPLDHLELNHATTSLTCLKACPPNYFYTCSQCATFPIHTLWTKLAQYHNYSVVYIKTQNWHKKIRYRIIGRVIKLCVEINSLDLWPICVAPHVCINGHVLNVSYAKRSASVNTSSNAATKLSRI